MSKLDDLTLSNGVRRGSNIVRQPVDDIAVIKYLDVVRRRATTVEEVEVIDAIVKALFHEGMNKITGHGERVARDAEAVTDLEPESDPAPKFDKKAYQRDLMRKKRAAAKA